MKVILVIGEQATGKTQLIRKMMETTHQDWFYKAIGTVEELKQMLLQDEKYPYFLESNSVSVDNLHSNTYGNNIKGQYQKSLMWHPHLVEVILCRHDSVPYYHFDLPF